eukprot:8547017-Pyramimonas_sp.AAC.1
MKSRLEERSVSAKMNQDYDFYLKEFRDFCTENGLPTGISAHTDLLLVDYFDVKFLDGHGPSLAEKTIVAVQFAEARTKSGQIWSPARAQRALKGWRK